MAIWSTTKSHFHNPIMPLRTTFRSRSFSSTHHMIYLWQFLIKFHYLSSKGPNTRNLIKTLYDFFAFFTQLFLTETIGVYVQSELSARSNSIRNVFWQTPANGVARHKQEDRLLGLRRMKRLLWESFVKVRTIRRLAEIFQEFANIKSHFVNNLEIEWLKYGCFQKRMFSRRSLHSIIFITTKQVWGKSNCCRQYPKLNSTTIRTINTLDRTEKGFRRNEMRYDGHTLKRNTRRATKTFFHKSLKKKFHYKLFQ